MAAVPCSSASAPDSAAQIVSAPDRPHLRYTTRLFLAGTTSAKQADDRSTPAGDWRAVVRAAVQDCPVTVLDPYRADWDGSWTEDPSFPPFRKQVEWELDMQQQATLMAFYFDAGRDGSVSLLELGLCIGRGPSRPRAMVGCSPGYAKRGNVLMVCARHGILVVDSPGALAGAIRAALGVSAEDEPE